MTLRTFTAFALAAAIPAAAQNPLARAAEVRQAIVARDATRALALLDTIRAAVPGHPNTVFLSAHAYGLAGRSDDARAALRQLAAWDGRFLQAALRDTNVAGLRAEFAMADSLARASAAQVSLGSAWATIAERDLIAEGTAWDPSTRSVLVGSLNKHKVVAIGPDGSVTERVAAGANGLRSVVGLHVDTTRGTLWVASNARYDTPADSTPSALFAFDARTGAFRARLTLPAGGPRFLNDVTTDPDGTVYVTDSQGGKVWHARPGATQLIELTALGRVLAPNGITISSDGRVLFVADVDHVRALDLRTGEAWRVVSPSDVLLSGIDGLAFTNGTLIAHHPLSFWRIAQYELSRDYRTVRRRRLIEANTPDGRTSTTGEIAGGSYVYIGNSQIDRMNLKTIDAATMEPIRMYRVALPLPAVADAPLPAAQREFLAALRRLCGRAYRGTLVEGNASDSTMRRATLTMHVRECADDEIRIPFHVDDDRSRTWVITPTASGLRLKHDHRHSDGVADAVTQYGGDTRDAGSATRQDFFADAHTASLIPAARTNVWAIEISPTRFAYSLRREGTDRRFRVEFDLTRPVDPPPAPWGRR